MIKCAVMPFVGIEGDAMRRIVQLHVFLSTVTATAALAVVTACGGGKGGAGGATATSSQSSTSSTSGSTTTSSSSGGVGAGSCDYTTAGIHNCVDFSAGYKSASTICSNDGGTLNTTMACSHTGSAGGCQTTSSLGTQTLWYYGNNTPAGVQTVCTNTGGTYVSP